MKHLKIRLEKHELKIVYFARRKKLFCQNCQIETQHLSVAQMAAVFTVSEITIFRLADSKQIHSTETEDGKLIICVNTGKIRRSEDGIRYFCRRS